MAGQPPTAICLTDPQRSVLEQLTRRSTSPQRLVCRAKIIRLADAGQTNTAIAKQLHLARQTVGKWRRRWASGSQICHNSYTADSPDKSVTEACVSLLNDAPRPGAKTTFTPEQIVHLISIACTPPEASERAVTHWSHRELAAEGVKRQIVKSISPRSVGRFLKRGGFTPS
jgi:putative transposase